MRRGFSRSSAVALAAPHAFPRSRSMHSSRSRRLFIPFAAASLAVVALTLAVSAAPSSKKPDAPAAKADKAAELDQQGMSAVTAQYYAKALEFFQQGGKIRKDTPDTLNMT